MTEPGDTWDLGPHRLMCGSATDADDLQSLLGGRVPDLIYTDPPYGIGIVKGNRPDRRVGQVGGSKPSTIGKVGATKIVHARWYEPVIGDETTATAVAALRLALDLYPKATQVWWGANHYAGDAGLPNSSCWLVWDKQTGASNFADAELAWTNHPGAVRVLAHQWAGMLRASERGARVHPTQKPVALAVWAYETMLKTALPGAIILDQFGGSGSALIAAEQTGAIARLMELSPAYCDVIARRYQNHTGTTPLRNGHPHDFTNA